MKAATLRRHARWEQVESQIAAGQPPKVFVDKAGCICLVDGAFQLPAALAAKMPAEVIAAARFAAEQRLAEEITRHEAWAANWEASQAALDARSDEPGFRLIAGEDSEIVASGTLRECRSMIPCVTRCQRDRFAGRGCWVIVDAAGVEVQAGQFDRDCAW